MYRKEERLDIGRQIYTHVLTKQEAMEEYQISHSSAEGYVTQYKKANGIPLANVTTKSNVAKIQANADLEAYQNMTRDELIRELILSKANELRAKKGYEVKGDGPNKEFNILNNKNSK